ncbi:transmembrane protein 60-like [Saccostrea cucullata]|uniref:transmembrane protein 60-like n=1 Tax=Saccostrea cuccullata TaxID=36930 RepID=UPI002ED340EB
MAILHRSLFTCISLLAFLILLALKLDKKVKWNWFLVFNPMWLFDGVIVIYITFKMIAQCKNRYNQGQVSMMRKVCYMCFVLLKMAFQVLLCMKLQYYDQEISLYFVMIPFWMLFIFVSSDVSHGLWRIATRDINVCGRR